ncbi:MAG TPA: FHA domain-containing protein [Gammaproteobacteria bacterium]|jgi:hypothetical protein
MTTLAIEINDAGLIVADQDRVIRSEPGFAVIDRGKIVTGDAAFALARLMPRDASSLHWAKLSIEPGSASVGGNRSTAELAHAQLEQIWQDVGAGVDHVIFVVPSTFEGEALGILLGLAEECGIPSGAIVDVACAASVRPWPDWQLVYVDADLQRVFVTPLEQTDEVTALTPVTLDSMGLSKLMDAFARRVAEIFVLKTRFDPFHHAETEQQLYSGLAAVLDALETGGGASFVITDSDDRFEIEIERSELLGAAQGFYRAVRQLIAQSRKAQSGLVVGLSHRLARLPGLNDELARLDATTVVELEPGHAARAVLGAADTLALADEGVRLFRHLPWRDEPAAPAAEPEAAPEPAPAVAEDESRPTHVVYRGIAYPVNGEALLVGRSKLDGRRAIVIESQAEGVSRTHCELAIADGELRLRDLSSFGTFVNERRIEGEEVVKPADVIRVGTPGAELIVVRAESADGA